MDRTIDEGRPRRRPLPLLVDVAIPLAAIAVIGGGVGFFTGDERFGYEQRVFDSRFGGTGPGRELSPAGYEALRGMVAEDPSLAPRVARALADGAVDTREMRRTVGDRTADPAPTTLDLAAARRDLAIAVAGYGRTRP